MACITHLKHTSGSIVTVTAADAFSTGESSGRKESGMGAITRQREIIDRRALTERLSLVAGSVQAPALDRSPFVEPLKAALTAGARRDPSAFRGDRRRRCDRPRAVLLDGPADPRAVRFRNSSNLPSPQPDFGRAAGNCCSGRLWARRARALFRYRSPVPTAVQADPAHRAGRRVSALPAVGSRPQDRASDPISR